MRAPDLRLTCCADCCAGLRGSEALGGKRHQGGLRHELEVRISRHQRIDAIAREVPVCRKVRIRTRSVRVDALVGANPAGVRIHAAIAVAMLVLAQLPKQMSLLELDFKHVRSGTLCKRPETTHHV